MSHRQEIQTWIVSALSSCGGKASLVQVAKFIWLNYRLEIDSSPTLPYTWQYDVRWAASELRKLGTLRPAGVSPKGIWELA